jgi:hypothetical protein
MNSITSNRYGTFQPLQIKIEQGMPQALPKELMQRIIDYVPREQLPRLRLVDSESRAYIDLKLQYVCWQKTNLDEILARNYANLEDREQSLRNNLTIEIGISHFATAIASMQTDSYNKKLVFSIIYCVMFSSLLLPCLFKPELLIVPAIFICPVVSILVAVLNCNLWMKSEQKILLSHHALKTGFSLASVNNELALNMAEVDYVVDLDRVTYCYPDDIPCVPTYIKFLLQLMQDVPHWNTWRYVANALDKFATPTLQDVFTKHIDIKATVSNLFSRYPANSRYFLTNLAEDKQELLSTMQDIKNEQQLSL